MPVLMLPWKPKGLPMATTNCPTCRRVESPRVTGESRVAGASTLSTARSLLVSLPTTVAVTVVPSEKTTEIALAPSTTWLLVTIWPWSSQMKPDPSPRAKGCRSPPGGIPGAGVAGTVGRLREARAGTGQALHYLHVDHRRTDLGVDTLQRSLERRNCFRRRRQRRRSTEGRCSSNGSRRRDGGGSVAAGVGVARAVTVGASVAVRPPAGAVVLDGVAVVLPWACVACVPTAASNSSDNIRTVTTDTKTLLFISPLSFRNWQGI